MASAATATGRSRSSQAETVDTQVIVVCIFCGSEFRRSERRQRWRDARGYGPGYCGDGCRKAHQAQRMTERRRNAPPTAAYDPELIELNLSKVQHHPAPRELAEGVAEAIRRNRERLRSEDPNQRTCLPERPHTIVKGLGLDLREQLAVLRAGLFLAGDSDAARG